MLKLVGIDLEKYKTHSTRGALRSSAQAVGANLNAIMRNASWKDTQSFAMFYHKSLDDPGEFRRLILKSPATGEK